MKSLMALSMHKAGSSIADVIFTEIAGARGYQIDRISKKVLVSSLPENDVYWESQSSMVLEGFYYGMARNPGVHTMPILDKLRLLLQVRDPRDCITSMYFSLRESHVLPSDPEKRRALEERRARLQERPIDSYAISATPQYFERMTRLKKIQEAHPDALVLRYEDMVENTQYWLDSVLRLFDQPLTDELQTTLERHLDFNVASEDSGRHKRQVKPGDHRRKLKAETIAQMNTKLAPVLQSFGYSE